MHVTEPDRLPDIDTGLHVVRWKVPGFLSMREAQLLDPRRSFELVDGLVLHRSDRSQDHDDVVTELARRLAEAPLDGAPTVEIDRELRFEALDAVVTPDIAVLERHQVPRLVVEVSDDAPRLDAMEKAHLYARAGVELYWHIDLAWTMFGIHTHPRDHGYGLRVGGPPHEPVHTWLPALPELNLHELLEASGCRPR